MIRRISVAVRRTAAGFRKRWRHIGRRRLPVMRKLDESKIRWIINQKTRGATNRSIADAMKISVRHVQRIHARCLRTGAVPVLRDSGRPRRKATPQETRLVLDAHGRYCCGAVYLEWIIENTAGIHIPHNLIHRILRDSGLASEESAKQARRSWVRYERTYSNSMWHTDYKLLDDGRWFIAYQDDASRFIVAYGVFAEATGRHAIEVLHEAVKRHGRPASILTDRGTQFYASESESRRKGVSEFEQELVRLGIRHILARVNHPQTNGKLERFHGELQRKLHHFGTVDRLVHWWNHIKPHRSLDWSTLETPARAFKRKMPEKGTTVTDEQSGESYNVT